MRDRARRAMTDVETLAKTIPLFLGEERHHLEHVMTLSVDTILQTDGLPRASYLRYAMQSYRSEVFYSAPLHLRSPPLIARDSDAIERSSVPLGKIRNTPLNLVTAAMRYYLRPLKRLYVQTKVGRFLRR